MKTFLLCLFICSLFCIFTSTFSFHLLIKSVKVLFKSNFIAWNIAFKVISVCLYFTCFPLIFSTPRIFFVNTCFSTTILYSPYLHFSCKGESSKYGCLTKRKLFFCTSQNKYFYIECLIYQGIGILLYWHLWKLFCVLFDGVFVVNSNLKLIYVICNVCVHAFKVCGSKMSNVLMENENRVFQVIVDLYRSWDENIQMIFYLYFNVYF